MDVEFFAADPRSKARHKLDSILSRGVDQLAVACGFCTGAGVELLSDYINLLRKPDSFVVVSVAPPTDYQALGALHDAMPGHLYVHWGSLLPVEIRAGAALMHSKVFYARHRDECWLWTGSHNLTGNATQGGNCEAAVLLHGSADDKPFTDALAHLRACRDEATVYDPESKPPGKADPANILVIHSESDGVPALPLPWHVHLCLETEDFDELLSPPADVRLLLYPRNSLSQGWQNATPVAAYAGSLTGQNLTASNSRASRAGILAQWRAANFCISESGRVPLLGPDQPPGPSIKTQALFNVFVSADPDDILFSDEPKVERRMVEGERSTTPVDPDMHRFFSRTSVQGSRLVHVPYTGRHFIIRAPGDEARERDFPRLRNLLAEDRDIPLELETPSPRRIARRHPFIMRARYRVRDGRQKS
jgi:hypothetical protein